MYKKGIKKPGIGPKINIGIVVLLACITLFAFRVYKVLISSSERAVSYTHLDVYKRQ